MMDVRIAALVAALMLINGQRAFAADAAGLWSTVGGKAQVRVRACGDALCGVIVRLKEPTDPKTGRPKTDKRNVDPSKRSRPLIGVPIVLGMKPDGTPGEWVGQVYNAEDGKTYSGSIRLTGTTTLELQGCALGGLICKSQTWTRIK